MAPMDAPRLIRLAHDVRAKVLAGRRSTHLRDAYSTAYFLARRLHGRYRDVRIMVGDCATSRGAVQHHWLEIPSRDLYLDPTFDEFDPALPVRVGKISDPEYAALYLQRANSLFDVTDPRNHPRYVYAPVTPYSAERN